MKFVYNFNDRSSKDFKIIKILKWYFYCDVIFVWTFIEVCVYYWMWIKNFVMIVAFIFQLVKKKTRFVRNKEQKNFMNLLKLTLIIALIMKNLNYFDQVEKIIVAMNASFQYWNTILQQTTLNFKNRHSIKYENELWNEQEIRYDAEKRECQNLMKTLKKVRFWLYEIKFIIEINANTLIIQLSRSALNLSNAFICQNNVNWCKFWFRELTSFWCEFSLMWIEFFLMWIKFLLN